MALLGIGVIASLFFMLGPPKLLAKSESPVFCGSCHVMEAFLRQTLTKAGEEVPVQVDLELDKYLDNHGKKKLMRQEGVEIKGPFGVQERLVEVEPMN